MRTMADYARRSLQALMLTAAVFTSAPAMAGADVFPLHVSTDGRHLNDVFDRPFLITGDTASSLLGDLSREEIELYLRQRQRLGFNTLLVNMIEHRFSRRPPSNFYGEPPFRDGRDFAAPNDTYFDHVEWFLRRARAHGFLVFMAPAYMGVSGGPEGWYQKMTATGPGALKAYGEYLGRRFGGFPNIVWVHGGDYDPPDKALVEAVVAGLMAAAPNALQTVHGAIGSRVRQTWYDASWIDIDTLYTYEDTAVRAGDLYRTNPAKPFVLLEGRHENEADTDAAKVRAQAYGSLLSGAAGQFFGNNPVWHFAGPGVFAANSRWQDALDSPGAQSMAYLNALFEKIAWWALEPDPSILAHEGGLPVNEMTIPAAAKDRSFAIVYVTDVAVVRIRRDALPPTVMNRARWFDPSSGASMEAEPIESPRSVGFQVPAIANAAGDSDWLLLLGQTEAAVAHQQQADGSLR